MDSVKDYIELVNAPWGRMFYDLLFMQLIIPQSPKLNILDFGSGLGVTANHYAAWHNVTAVEPDAEMIENSCKDNKYVQLHDGINALSGLQAGSFNYIFCHNVLEYIENKEEIVSELMRILTNGGILSIVKHNRTGRIFQSAVFGNDPKKAIALMDLHTYDKSNYLGTQYIYTNADLKMWAERYGGIVKKVYGMRTFWALSQDNSVKYSDEWYQSMLELEHKVEDINDYKQVAFFNHLFIQKITGV